MSVSCWYLLPVATLTGLPAPSPRPSPRGCVAGPELPHGAPNWLGPQARSPAPCATSESMPSTKATRHAANPLLHARMLTRHVKDMGKPPFGASCRYPGHAPLQCVQSVLPE